MDRKQPVMGVRGLFSFLKKEGTLISLEEIRQSPRQLSIGVDISYYIHRWHASAEKVLEFIEQLSPHRVILIFDGRAPDDKIHEHNRRVKEKEDASAAAIALKESMTSCELSDQQKAYLEKQVQQLEKQGWQITKEIRHAFKEKLYESGVPLLKSKGEADSLLVALALNGDIDVVISGDMDLLVQGVPCQWCPIGTSPAFRAFNRPEVLQNLGVSCKQFRSFCAMCSTDYTEKEQKLDIVTAYQGIRIYKNIATLMKKHPQWLQEWPKPDHPYFQINQNPLEWIPDDQVEWYVAWQAKDVMPYAK